jgi:hypothetical protein
VTVTVERGTCGTRIVVALGGVDHVITPEHAQQLADQLTDAVASATVLRVGDRVSWTPWSMPQYGTILAITDRIIRVTSLGAGYEFLPHEKSRLRKDPYR